jgi:hypothetical protein
MTIAFIVMAIFGVIVLGGLVWAAVFMASPKNWRVVCVDAVSGAEKVVGGVFPTEEVAQFAARRRINELAQLQAAAPARDQVWVVRPNGERYRMDTP